MVVVIIVLLFMVVVFALGVHHYTKVFWWRRSSQSQSQSQSRSIVALGTGTGLHPLILRCLPVSIFQRQDSSKDGLECSVCLSELVEGEKLRILPGCNHGFHVDCIDMWLQSHNTCPLCRTKVVATLSWSYLATTNTTRRHDGMFFFRQQHDGMLVIDILGHTEEETPSSSSPVIRRLKSLQRLLSNNRLNPWSATSTETRRRRTQLAN